MTAIYASRPAPELGPTARRYTLECPHGRTEGVAENAEIAGETAILEALLLKHDAAEGCGCTRELWRTVRLAKLLRPGTR